MSTFRHTLPPCHFFPRLVSIVIICDRCSFFFFCDFSWLLSCPLSSQCVMTCFYYQELSRKAINTPLPCSNRVLWRKALFIMTKTRRIILHPHLLLPLANDFVILEENIQTDTNIQPMLFLLSIWPYTRNFSRLQLAEPHALRNHIQIYTCTTVGWTPKGQNCVRNCMGRGNNDGLSQRDKTHHRLFCHWLSFQWAGFDLKIRLQKYVYAYIALVGMGVCVGGGQEWAAGSWAYPNE